MLEIMLDKIYFQVFDATLIYFLGYHGDCAHKSNTLDIPIKVSCIINCFNIKTHFYIMFNLPIPNFGGTALFRRSSIIYYL